MALYPPIIASSLPAFDLGQGYLPLEFSLSKYNSKSEINTIQITVRRHLSNVNVVENDIYSYPFSDETVTYDSRTNLYKIQLPLSSINMNADSLYRVQLRFSYLILDNSDNSTQLYTNNPSQFSEWSTVCIVKPINAPNFYLKDLDSSENEGIDAEDDFTLDYVTADFIGVYDGTNTSQILYKWRLRLLQPEYDEKDSEKNIDDYTIIDSNWTFVGSYSYTENSSKITFNCNLNYEFPDPASEYGYTEYQVLFEIETRNGYTDSKLYPFTLSYSKDLDSVPKGTIIAIVNEEEGYIKVRYTPTNESSRLTNWVLRRTSSTSNFLFWEDIRYIDTEVFEDDVPIEYIDYTVESGIIYKYGIQTVNIYGRRGILKASEECMGEWEHAFLLEGFDKNARQLKLKYDFDISSYKTNVSESKTDTIGSRYPFVRRNGNMYYRSFPITGIITALMDDEELFTDNSQLYGTSKIVSQFTRRENQTNEDIYEEFFGTYDNYVNRYNYTHERKFRERVEAFLYNQNVKLYKSMQEGNILIKLMEVSLTPKKELGRLIYTFSATAYEIANVHQVYWHNNNIRAAATKNPTNLGAGVFSDSNVNIIQTLNDNGFFNIGTYKSDITYEDKQWKIGQITCYGGYNQNTRLPIVNLTNLTDIRKAIINKYWGKVNTDNIEIDMSNIQDIDQNDNTYISDMIIRSIHIEADNKPYLIPENTIKGIAHGTFYEKDKLPYLGTLVHFNGSNFIIPSPHTIYNVIDNKSYNIRNTPFTIDNFIGTVDFIYKLRYSIDKSKQVYKTTSKNINGYLDYSDIRLGGNLINLVQMKYKQDYTTETDIVETKITGVNQIIIDSDPGTVLEIITSDSEQPETIVVNETGTLRLDTCDSNTIITSLKVTGVYEQGTIIAKKPNILLYYFITTKTNYTKRSL